MKIAFFTAGNMGLGHVMRGLAIARALCRRGAKAQFRIFSPVLAPVHQEWAELESVRIVQEDLEDPLRALETPLVQSLAAYKPDLLIVDLFWAPLVHAYASLACEAWLLVRTVPLWWFSGTRRRSFERCRFARILAIEPLLHRFPAEAETINPIVVSNPEDCRMPGALRERLGFVPGRRLSVAIQAGRPGEVLQLGASPDSVYWDPAARLFPFPASEWLRDADEIFAGAGYNTFWESVWLGYFSRTIFVPFPRPIDNQSRRLKLGVDMKMTCNGADTLAAHITGPKFC